MWDTLFTSSCGRSVSGSKKFALAADTGVHSFPAVNGDCWAQLWERRVSKAELARRGAKQRSSSLLLTKIISSFVFFSSPL